MRRDEKPLRRTNPSGKVRWVARYTDRDGKRRSAGTYTKAGACKTPTGDGRCCAQHAIWAAYEASGTRREEEPETVGSYFESWLDRHPRQERTAAGYEARIRSVLGIAVEGRPLGEWELDALRRRQMARLVDALLRDRALAAGTTRAVVSVLRTMFEDAITDDVMDSNPAIGVRLRDNDPRVQTPRRRPVLASWEQMHAFARAAGPHEPLIRVLSDCGLRLGEMLALERCHDCKEHLIVENNAWRGTSSPGTKQGDSRVVPIPPGLRAILDAYATPLRGPLFPAPSGGVWHDSSFYRTVWYPAQRASGMKLRPHDFRHSFVSHMRAAGADPADLAEVTGQTVATATSIYTHSTGTTFDLMRRAVG